VFLATMITTNFESNGEINVNERSTNFSAKELVELESYITDIWQFLPLPIAYLTPIGVIVDADEAFEKFLGQPKDKIIGSLLTDLCQQHGEIIQIQKETFEKDQVKNCECTLTIKEKKEIPVSISTLVRKDESGEAIGYFIAFVDLTEQKLSEEKYRAAVEQSVESIYILDYETKQVLEANTSLQDILGYTGKELKQLTVYDFVAHPRQDIDTKIDEVIKKKRVHLGERHYRRKDGSLVDVEVSASHITYGSKKAISVVSRNITERKKAEQDIKRSLNALEETIESTIEAMARVVETRDPYTAGHQRRVANLAYAIAKEMNLPEKQINGIKMASLIHDVGKLYVPAEILVKPTKLTEIEFGMVKTHPQVGYEILKTIKFPWPVADIILQHHERFNGSGYLQGLTNKDILLEARILAIADVVEAMSSHRPYRPARGMKATLEEIENNKGILYDPEIANICIKLFKEKNFEFDLKID